MSGTIPLRNANALAGEAGSTQPWNTRTLWVRPLGSKWRRQDNEVAVSILKRPSDRPGYHLIFRPWYVHPKTGRRVYPRSGRVFPIWVKD
jgi:hypothetical protein